MKKKDYEDYKEKANNNEPINLTGYTSTSKDIEVAVRFALNDLTEDKLAVIFVLDFKSQKGLFEMSKGYTAFPGEDEVLVQDGLQYLITKTEQISIEGQEVYCLHFQYPAKK